MTAPHLYVARTLTDPAMATLPDVPACEQRAIDALRPFGGAEHA